MSRIGEAKTMSSARKGLGPRGVPQVEGCLESIILGK